MANAANHNVDWDEARLISYENVNEVEVETVALASAMGRTTATQVVAQSDLPPAHTAMMDGFAVSGTGPWRISGEVRAGQYQEQIEPGTAIKVSTGAHIPPACSFVIPIEDAIVFDGDIASKVPIPIGKHIRVPGDEATTGEVILESGKIISPAAAGLISSSSIDEVSVRKIPYVDILITGDELISSGFAAPGQIRDSLSIQIPSWISNLGGQVGQLTRVQDEGNVTRSAIASCLAPIIITTGGTAHGDYDYVRSALTDLGAQILIDEINMRPGHPTVLAKLPSGQLVASLPGNPLAALVAFLTIVAPALNRLLGQPLKPLGSSILAKEFATQQTRIVPVKIENGKAIETKYRGSAMLRGLVLADALAVIPAGDNPVGSPVRLLELPW